MFSLMLKQLSEDESVKHSVEQLIEAITSQKTAGVLVVVDGSDLAITSLFIAEQAILAINENSDYTYSGMIYFLDDELYDGVAKSELLAQFKTMQPIQLNLDEAVDEVILEAEYSYKKLGTSKHMAINIKKALRLQIALATAHAIAADLNLLKV